MYCGGEELAWMALMLFQFQGSINYPPCHGRYDHSGGWEFVIELFDTRNAFAMKMSRGIAQ